MRKARTIASWLMTGSATPLGSELMPCSSMTVRLQRYGSMFFSPAWQGWQASKYSPMRASASHIWFMGQSQTKVLHALQLGKLQPGQTCEHAVEGQPVGGVAIMARGPRPFGHLQPVVKTATANIDTVLGAAYPDSLPQPVTPVEEGHEGLPDLQGKDLERVTTDNAVCAFVLGEIQRMHDREGGAVRENPPGSLHWWGSQEVAMFATGQWWATPLIGPDASISFSGTMWKSIGG